MTITTIDKKDGLAFRTITVEQTDNNTFLKVTDESGGREIQTSLTLWQSKALPKLIDALAGENATVVTDLPEVELSLPAFDTREVARAGVVSRYVTADPERVLAEAKDLLAIRAFLIKRNEEQEAAKVAEAEAVKAKEEANAKRRDELALEFWGYGCSYSNRSSYAKKAIDRIIELEAAKVS